MYDDFVNRKRPQRHKKCLERSAAVGGSFPQPLEAPAQKNLVRGYDNPELFREDLWLRRIDHARREHAVVAASMRRAGGVSMTADDHKRRVSEILAHHPDPKSNN
jgi:hypothetical protein